MASYGWMLQNLPKSGRIAPTLTRRIAKRCIPLGQVRCQRYSSSPLGDNTVRIGCASGFWGDSAVAAPQLVKKGNIEFLVFDYLSEITMSLLAAMKNKSGDLGYAADFVSTAMAPSIKEIKHKGIKVISNAGGVNPESCAAAVHQVAKKAGVDLNIAVITGDDMMSMKSEFEASNVVDMYSGRKFPKTITSMTAYLGAGAISSALNKGADMVITGRCVDSALVLAPLIHKFGWKPDQFDLLASGSLAGHLIECGAQCTGGNFTDWDTIPDYHNIGFPVVECSPSGDFILTKPPGTGGLVSFGTAAEQMLYEIGDPQNYVLPDVVCDFSQVAIASIPEQEDEAVLVRGVKGKPPTNQYKVSATYADGYRMTGVFAIGGPRAAEKGRKTAEAILKRVRGIYKAIGMSDFTKTHLQTLGTEDTYGPHATPGQGPREVAVWLAANHQDKRALQILASELAPAGTGMAPGLMGLAGGRPKVSPVLKLFSFVHPKNAFKISVHVNGKSEPYEQPQVETKPIEDSSQTESGASQEVSLGTGTHSYRLEELAYTRSGDKGNNCNIGVIARHPSFLPYIRQALSSAAVDQYMAHVFDDRTGTVESRVTRYEVPGIHGLNFILHNSLGGGGIASLRSDPQGKAFGQMLLDFKIKNIPDLKDLANTS